MDIVALVADNSMQSAVEEVKALPEYSSKEEVRYCTVCIYLFMSYSISVGDNYGECLSYNLSGKYVCCKKVIFF